MYLLLFDIYFGCSRSLTLC